MPTTRTPLDTLQQLLQKEFPKMWIKDGEEFDGVPGKLWTGEGSMVTIPGHPVSWDLPLFDYYAESHLYEMGVWKPLAEFVRKHGYYCECNDPGTYFIYPN